MGASAQQIASARALAQSRGYDPNLVDADNADRASSAFPVQGGGGHVGGTPLASASAAPVAAVGMPDPTLGAGGITPSGTAPATSALNNVVNTPAADTSGAGLALSALGGGAGAVGNQENTGTVDEQSGGMYRALGVRNPPQSMLALRKQAY